MAGRYPKVTEVQAKVSLTYICPKMGLPTLVNDPTLEHEGGCQGHGPDEYCYCSPLKYIAEWDCTACGGKHKARLN